MKTLAQAKAEFPKASDVSAATLEMLADLKARYLSVQPKPDEDVHAYAAHNRALFSAAGLASATPKGLRDFIVSNKMASPGTLSTFYKGLEDNGPEVTATSLRQTIDFLLRGAGPEEDRLTAAVGQTYGVGVVLLTKVLCVMQPDRFLALLPYESGHDKGKQDIGRLVFGLDMPGQDSTGLTAGRLAYWSNDLLRDSLARVPGPSFVDLEHGKEFLWNAFCYLQGWDSIFDELPTDPAEQAIDVGARDLTAGQGFAIDPQAVEKVGMDTVTDHFDASWEVRHVDLEKCGWDITATRGDTRLCIEVKATTGWAPTVFVTANELDKAHTNPDWVMAVVTQAGTDEPLLRWHTAQEVCEAVRPTIYRARLTASAGTDVPQAIV